MPEEEFERYLTLLAKAMRLTDAQRDAIVKELRDHMEQRLDELQRAGLPRDEAIQSALEEFGDTAGLATDLTHINPARRRTRKHLMQTSIGTLLACAAVTFAVMLLVPHNKNGQPTQLSAVGQPQQNHNPAPPYNDAPLVSIQSRLTLLSKDALPLSQQALIDSPWTPAWALTKEQAGKLLTDQEAQIQHFLAPTITLYDRSEAMLMSATQVSAIDPLTEQIVTSSKGLMIHTKPAYDKENKRIAMSISVNTEWQANMGNQEDKQKDHYSNPYLTDPAMRNWSPGVTGIQLQVRLDEGTSAAVVLPLSASKILELIPGSEIDPEQEWAAVLLVTPTIKPVDKS